MSCSSCIAHDDRVADGAEAQRLLRAGEVAEQRLDGVAPPLEALADRRHHGGTHRSRHRRDGVDRAQQVLRRCPAVVVELEAHELALTDQSVRAALQPDAVLLQAMTDPGLRDALPPLDLVHQVDQLVTVIGVEVGREVRGDGSEQDAAEPGRRVGGQVEGSQRHATCRCHGAREERFELRQHHGGNRSRPCPCPQIGTGALAAYRLAAMGGSHRCAGTISGGGGGSRRRRRRARPLPRWIALRTSSGPIRPAGRPSSSTTTA